MRRFEPMLAGAGAGALAAVVVMASDVPAYATAPLFGLALLLAFRREPLTILRRFAMFLLGTVAWILFLFSSYVLASMFAAYAYDQFALVRSWPPEWSYFAVSPLPIALWVGFQMLATRVGNRRLFNIWKLYLPLLGLMMVIALTTYVLSAVQIPKDLILIPLLFIGFWGGLSQWSATRTGPKSMPFLMLQHLDTN